MRKLKKLEDLISMSNADRPKTEGWAYSQGIDDLEPAADGVFRLYQVYAATDPAYTGKVTVPTLWDRERRTIVNNESSEIIRMFNSAFKTWTDVGYDFYPEDLRAEIDRINELVYSHFKCNVRRIQDYPNLANYLRELYQWPGIKDTLDLQKIKAGYYSQRNVNPTGIVPLGPTLDHLDQPHDRERLRAAA